MSSGYVHVLVAVDFSPFSVNAVRRAAAIARIGNAGLTMLHVVDYFPEDVPLEVVAPEDEDPADFLHRDASERLAELAREVGHEQAVGKVAFSTHSARHEIVRLAAEEGVDLIVIGSHGRRGLADYLGSTAHAVIHGAQCDVLVVRSE